MLDVDRVNFHTNLKTQTERGSVADVVWILVQYRNSNHDSGRSVFQGANAIFTCPLSPTHYFRVVRQRESVK